MHCDLLIKNGTIVDGTGQPSFAGDILISGGRIILVAERGALSADITARRVVECNGLVVCPGFIDVHSHMDFVLPSENHPEMVKCFLEQGITTIIGGNCGYSLAPLENGSNNLERVSMVYRSFCPNPTEINWDSMDSFLTTLEERGIALNLLQLTGHGTLCWSLWGRPFPSLDRAKIEKLKRIIEESFCQGSLGLSLGLGYEPGILARTDELNDLARYVKTYDKILTVHLRAITKISDCYSPNPLRGDHNLRAIEEMIDIAERTGVRLHISHLIFAGSKTWPNCTRALEMIDRARSRGIDIAFDSFPYYCANSIIYGVYPRWFLKDPENNIRSPLAKLGLQMAWLSGKNLVGSELSDIQLLQGGHPDLEQYAGMFIHEIAMSMGCSVIEALLKITDLSRGLACILIHKISGDDENDLYYRKILSHPLNLFATDALVFPGGPQNPAAFGAFPKVIHRYHRELGILSLEEAIAKMTGYSAKRFGIKDRGVIQAGKWADITIFDYEEIKDNTTSSNSGAKPSGIKYVFMNGEEVVKDGAALPGKKAGKVIRC